MGFLVAHWNVIVVIAIFIVGGCIAVYRFMSLSTMKRYEKLRGWLLQAVLLAEKEYGSGTGKLKLSAVYDKFVEKFPWLAKFISFSVFSEYVDDALDEMKDILAKNNAIAQIVGGD